MPDGQRIVVPTNGLGQGVDAVAQFLGTLARNWKLFPIDVDNWKKIPESTKNRAWEFVKRKFDLPDNSKAWALKNINIKWKMTLRKTYYKPNVPAIEQLDCPTPQIHKDQWVNLLCIWESDNFKKSSEVNKDNRSKKVINHCVGTKSYARIRKEAEDTGETFFKKTHTRKDGTPVDDASKEIMDKIDELLSQQTNENSERTTAAQDDMFAKALGKSERRALWA
ncbi:PREDICTED: uncharacterized protein LOC104586304 [Nelumbo nucifera]|uniref:Uncharacterized protein LOC104586304 n=1 Tax=Nelumbo nucifera TaxID=4432 RepID=A0A1U7YV91_NELNU|nr:PREDICTED: uncharacterized protein LOC104586304 [Nelumbo nucifera]